MIWRIIKVTPLLLLASCSTLNDSLKFGGGLGMASGVAALYAGHSAAGTSPPGGTIALGAGVGLGVGLLASYLIHREVEADREVFDADQMELHFGDLPPSPFMIPKTLQKGGKR